LLVCDPRKVILGNSSSSGRCARTYADQLLTLPFLGAGPRLLVAPAFLPPARPSRLDRSLKRAQSLGANNALEVRFDKDDVCAFRYVREILAAPPQIGVDGAFACSLDAHRDAIRERGVCAKMRRQDFDVERVEEDGQTGGSLVEVVCGR
jgi:hypothetical protein